MVTATTVTIICVQKKTKKHRVIESPELPFKVGDKTGKQESL
jgi:hypothetical protein